MPPREECGPEEKSRADPFFWIRSRPRLLLFFATVLAFSMWFFVDRVWAPPGEVHFSDLYQSWYASHELLLHHRDPYSAQVSHEIQSWIYGHPVSAKDARNENRFAYPLYFTLVLAPTVKLPFSAVEGIFRWLMPLLAIATALLWVATLGWRCSRPILGALVLLSLGNFPVLESVYLQQPGLIAGTFLAGAGAALASGRLGLAGVLLALATCKPQLCVPLALWLLLWAASGWRSRKNLVWGFAVTLLLLVGVTEILLPGWIGEFLAGLAAYQRYTGNFSILALLFANAGGTIASIGLVLAVAAAAWKMRHEPADSTRFQFGFCLVLALTVVVIPTMYPTSQIVLVPAVFWLAKNAQELWGAGRAVRLGLVGVLSLLVWPWIGSLVYLALDPLVGVDRLREYWLLPLSTILVFPLGVLTLFAILIPSLLELGKRLTRGPALTPAKLV